MTVAGLRAPIPELDRQGLRRFGWTTGVIVVVLFGLLLPWLLDFVYPAWPWVAGGLFLTAALAVPGWLRPVYRAWMRFGLLMSAVTTPLILGTVFFLVLTPISLIRRLAKGDPMRRRLDADEESYRIASRVPAERDLEKPF